MPLLQQRLHGLQQRLNGASPRSVLNRGFVIMRDPDGRPVMRRAGLRKGQKLGAEFADGVAPLRVEADPPGD